MPFNTLVPNVGSEIIAEVDGTRPPAGMLAVWFSGQAGFILKFPSGTVCYIDPWLSDLGGSHRAYPIPLDPGLVARCGVLLTSHDHGDHIHGDARPLIMRRSPRPMWVAPRGPPGFVRRLGGTAERTILLGGDESATVRDL